MATALEATATAIPYSTADAQDHGTTDFGVFLTYILNRESRFPVVDIAENIKEKSKSDTIS
jgi:hypothetical protein